MGRLNFDAWEKIFQAKRFDVAKDIHFVTANEIKEITNREPRLMGKMDSSSDVPSIMRKHGYFLLPVKNGEYAIVRGNGFHELEAVRQAGEFQSKLQFHLSTANSTTSEAQYLFQSFNSGLIEHVLDERPLLRTIGSRESSGPFSFSVGGLSLEVKSPYPQIEVDLGLEGPNSIALIEGKRPTKNFIIRQLYYPYRKYRRVSPRKSIIPIFFVHDSAAGTHNFWIYRFGNDDQYDSIQLVRQTSFKIITSSDVYELEDIGPITGEKIDDTPQADDVEKVMKLVLNVSEGVDSAGQMAKAMQFDVRQSSYYRKAAEALGLVESDKGKYYLTAIGEQFINQDSEGRIISFSQLMNNYSLIRISIDHLKERGRLEFSELPQLIDKYTNVGGSTVGRRAHTLRKWLEWVADRTGTFAYDQEGFAQTGK